MPKPSGQSIFLAAVAIGCAAALLWLAVSGPGELETEAEAGAGPTRLEKIPFDGAQAYKYLQQICDLGSRRSGSPGMLKQQELLEQHFADAGGKVARQGFRVRHPQTGAAVDMANLIVEWHPERSERVLLCTHYDTRPFPDRDPSQSAGQVHGRQRRGQRRGPDDGVGPAHGGHEGAGGRGLCVVRRRGTGL